MRKTHVARLLSFVSLAGMLICLVVVFGSSLIFMAKDNNYAHTLYDYFKISPTAFKELMFLPVSKLILVRLINSSSVLFVYFSLCFCLFFQVKRGISRRYRAALLVLAVQFLQMIVFDPWVYSMIYNGRMGFLPDVVALRSTYEIMNSVTIVYNSLLIVAGLNLLGFTFYRSWRHTTLRAVFLVVMFGYTLLSGFYLYIFYPVPQQFLKISRVANYISFESLKLGRHSGYYYLAPYLVIGFFVVLLIAVIIYLRIATNLKTEKAVFSTTIKSANMVSRTFSHYMKNELLAISMDLGSITTEDKRVNQVMDRVLERCEEIYSRLDNIHQNSSKMTLNLSEWNVYSIVLKAVESVSGILHDVDVRTTLEPPAQHVICDEYYLGEVFKNLIRNAAEAMEATEGKQLIIHAYEKDDWVHISITDNGPGIPEHDLDKVFDPFFSTKPTRTNWGVGLTTCQKIVMAHDGKIKAENTSEMGARFTVILPTSHD